MRWIPLFLLVASCSVAAVQHSFGGSLPSSAEESTPRVGYFLLSAPYNASGIVHGQSFVDGTPLAWLEGYRHIRLLPGDFKSGDIKYHFDGLATLLSVQFGKDGNSLKYVNKPFLSEAQTDWMHCSYEATGTSHLDGLKPCLRNPAVNLLPIGGELWLTIDTYLWGRVDLNTMETIGDAVVNVDGVTLNAHPACDASSGECYVQHPCPERNPRLPRTALACVSRLAMDGEDLRADILKRVTLPYDLIIQHSHEPCITENWVVSKLDSFEFHDPFNQYSGMLELMQQEQNNLYLLWNRNTNASHVVSGGPKFVNNHFGNCYEDAQGDIHTLSVPATSEYLFSYFQSNLAGPPHWTSILEPPLACVFSSNNSWTPSCSPAFSGQTFSFDYPTYNQQWKANPESKFLYGISQQSLNQSKWFDRIIKMNTKEGTIVASWSSPNIYLTEADFIARPGANAEDDGVLISLAFNQTSQSSFFLILQASTLDHLASFQMDNDAYPFHAHGISCDPSGKCVTNP